MQMPSGSSTPIGNFDQPVLAIVDPQSFQFVHSAIESSFSSGKLGDFFKGMSNEGVRVRDFESVLGKGLLGEKTRGEYAKLGNADQGQIREFYLASLEQVAPEVRQKFFKLYAYY